MIFHRIPKEPLNCWFYQVKPRVEVRCASMNTGSHFPCQVHSHKRTICYNRLKTLSGGNDIDGRWSDGALEIIMYKQEWVLRQTGGLEDLRMSLFPWGPPQGWQCWHRWGKLKSRWLSGWGWTSKLAQVKALVIVELMFVVVLLEMADAIFELLWEMAFHFGTRVSFFRGGH